LSKHETAQFRPEVTIDAAGRETAITSSTGASRSMQASSEHNGQSKETVVKK
jgi:hypothetical protein